MCTLFFKHFQRSHSTPLFCIYVNFYFPYYLGYLNKLNTFTICLFWLFFYSVFLCTFLVIIYYCGPLPKSQTHHEAKRVIYCGHISYDSSLTLPKKTCGHTAAYSKSSSQWEMTGMYHSARGQIFPTTQGQNHLALHKEDELFLSC